MDETIITKAEICCRKSIPPEQLHLPAMPELNFSHNQPTAETLVSFSVNCKGDACVGDTVLFERAVYVGEYPDAVMSHHEKVMATIVKDSYGARKQQHTFTLEVHWSSDGRTGRMVIKGRNLYRKGTLRQLWEKEAERNKVLDEKHQRGSSARQKRAIRKKGLK